MKLKFYRNMLAGRIEFLLYERLPDGKRRIIEPVQLMTKIVETSFNIEPTFWIDDFDAKDFLKDLAEQLKKGAR